MLTSRDHRPTRILCAVVLLLSACEQWPSGPADLPVSALTVAGISTPRMPGQTQQLTATATLSNGTSQAVSSVATWRSSNPSVATVSATGMLTALAPGQAFITATYRGVSGDLAVLVTSPPNSSAGDSISVASISPAPGNLIKGSDVTFTAVVNYRLASADSARIPMIIQDQNNQRLQVASSPAATVGRGSGTVTLTDRITIPPQGVTAVHVFLALFPSGATSTSTVVRVSFTVP